MTTPPARPKIYHITHIDTLARISTDGRLVSDAEMIRRGGPPVVIGMSDIKQRRVERLPVPCHPGTKVGDYVPFYFCPRSIMLYLIHMANHPDLAYRGGQGPIVHLEADLKMAIDWLDENGRLWAFSLSNAGANYTEFRSSVDHLDQLAWDSIEATDFRASSVKEGKQAEFLAHDYFPFELVERIGIKSRSIEARVEDLLMQTAFTPEIEVMPTWSY